MDDAPQNRASAAALRARLRAGAGKKNSTALGNAGVAKRARGPPPASSARVSSPQPHASLKPRADEVGVVATGPLVRLCVPFREQLVADHLVISPASGLSWDDAGVWAEALRLRASLGAFLCFLHVQRGPKARGSVMHAVPVSDMQLREARGVFKREMAELGDEFAGRRKIIQVADGTHPGRVIPGAMDYFAVLFGEQGGLAKVVDYGEEGFGPAWAGDVVLGILDLEPRIGRGRVLSRNERERLAKDFRERYAMFNDSKRKDDS